jgi:hypothetical protein
VIARTLARSLSRNLSRALSGIVDTITKVLIDLSPTSNGFYSIGTDVVLTTAYTLGISAILPTDSTTYALFGRSSSATDYLKLLSTGFLSLDVDGTVVTSTVAATKDSEFRHYSVTLDGNDFIFKEKDTVISTVTNATAAGKTLTINLIGNSNGANFYPGVLSDPQIGPQKFNLNELTKNYELPVDNVFGSEEITNNDYSNGTTDWYSTRNNSILTVNGGKLRSTTLVGATIGQAQELTGLTIGQAYLLKNATVTASLATETVSIRVAPSAALNETTNEATGTGTVTFDAIFFATATTMYVGTVCANIDAGGFVELDANITARSVTKSLAYNNIGFGDDVRGTYSLIDGAYFGSEKVINGDFATGDLTGFDETRDGQLTTVSGGSAVIDLNGLPDGGLQQDNINVLIGSTLAFTFDLNILEDFTDSNFFSVAAGSFSDTGVLESGRQSFIVVAAQAQGNIRIRAGLGTNFTGIYSLRNISLRRKIEVA